MTESSEKTITLLDALITGIIHDLPLEGRVSTANLDEDEFRVLELVLGKYMRHRLNELNQQGNKELLHECRAKSG
jgi:hypothetical protein